ncbi:MAG: YqeG family HAD IIIA-type phosphatase [Armatimonadetes bacterium]|nr:YqeG family HAD IIIA-type phosphatase [Armatimonadota bacterium]
MSFRTGEFQRDELRGFFRPFCPARALDTVEEINLEALRDRGKKLILLDVDNTLVDWRKENFTEPVLAWLDRAKALGFHLALLSNTRHPERLHRLADRLGIPVMQGKFKPSRTMFLSALSKFGVNADEAIMIGDQLFTDVLGANRTGIEAVWVKQRSPKDFIGTKVSRMGERFMRSRLYRVLVEAENPVEGIDAETRSSAQNSINTQLFRFVVVGATSFFIDATIRFMLCRFIKVDGRLLSQVAGEWLEKSFTWWPWHEPGKQAYPPFILFAALVAMYNSFVWNRRWTFEIQSAEDRSRQLVKFYTISIIGLFLNTFITTRLDKIISGHPTLSLGVATVLAALFVAVWNFLGQRFFAFRSKS